MPDDSTKLACLLKVILGERLLLLAHVRETKRHKNSRVALYPITRYLLEKK